MARNSYAYNPNRSADWNYGGSKWRLSRSKIDLYMECPRCFYLDNKLGTKRPGMPSFTLNLAVDTLFKREFDVHRKARSKHPIMEAYAVDAVPFSHRDLDTWRDNFKGLSHTHESTGLVVSGAVDDIWEQSDGSLIVVDYKATSKSEKIETLSDSAWEEQYTRQIGVYQWLLEKNGFSVSSIGYFVYANGNADASAFNNTLTFETTLVPCEGSKDWIEDTLIEIKASLDTDSFPRSGDTCEYCPYREACGKKLQTIHNSKK